MNLGQRFSLSDFNEMPVYLILAPDRFDLEKGPTRNDDRGIENDDMIRITNNTPDARENAFDPTNDMIVTTSNIKDA